MFWHSMDHLQSDKFRLRVKAGLKHMTKPKHHDQKGIFFVAFDISLSRAHFILVFWLGVKIEFLLYPGIKKFVAFFQVALLKQIVNGWFNRLLERLNCVEFSQTSLKNWIDMVTNQGNSIVAVQIGKLLETCANLEKYFTKTCRKNIFIPVR